MLKSKKNIKNLRPGSLPYIWHGMTKNTGAMIGLGLLAALLIMCFISPLILEADYSSINMKLAYLKPCGEHIFGCDELGRDILARVLYGARYTLLIGVGSTAMAAVIGVMLGAVAGHFGGFWDSLIMRCMDVLQSFPGIVSAIAVATVLGTGLFNSIVAIGIAFIPAFVRLMRANVMCIRGSEYIEASVSLGASTPRVLFKHLIPNSISPIIVQISLQIAQGGLTASTLSFLGLGVKDPMPEWGAMISSARGYIRQAPHMVIIPGLFIMLTLISLNLVGDALRDALDPKLRD